MYQMQGSAIVDNEQLQKVVDNIKKVDAECCYCVVYPSSSNSRDHYIVIKMYDKIILAPKFCIFEG